MYIFLTKFCTISNLFVHKFLFYLLDYFLACFGFGMFQRDKNSFALIFFVFSFLMTISMLFLWSSYATVDNTDFFINWSRKKIRFSIWRVRKEEELYQRKDRIRKVCDKFSDRLHQHLYVDKSFSVDSKHRIAYYRNAKVTVTIQR